MITNKFDIGIETGILGKDIKMTIGDYDAYTIEFTYYSKGIKFDVSDYIVRLNVKSPRGIIRQYNMTGVDRFSTRIVMSQSAYSEQGEYEAQVQIYKADNITRLSIPPFKYTVKKALINDDSIESSESFSLVQDLIVDLNKGLKTIDIDSEEIVGIKQNVEALGGEMAQVQDSIDTMCETLNQLDIATEEEINTIINTIK